MYLCYEMAVSQWELEAKCYGLSINYPQQVYVSKPRSSGGGTFLGSFTNFRRRGPAGARRSQDTGPWSILCPCPHLIPASHPLWSEQESCATCHDVCPSEASNHILNPPKPWAKIGPYSLKLFLSGFWSQWQEQQLIQKLSGSGDLFVGKVINIDSIF
jgi:hypothetical protein